MFDFEQETDRAVITAGGEPFAVADGSMREVPTRPFFHDPSRPCPDLAERIGKKGESD